MMLKSQKAVDPEKGRAMLHAVQLDDNLFTHTPMEVSGDSSKESQLPELSLMILTSCCAMNRRETWIQKPVPASWSRCQNSTARAQQSSW